MVASLPSTGRGGDGGHPWAPGTIGSLPGWGVRLQAVLYLAGWTASVDSSTGRALCTAQARAPPGRFKGRTGRARTPLAFRQGPLLLLRSNRGVLDVLSCAAHLLYWEKLPPFFWLQKQYMVSINLSGQGIETDENNNNPQS